MLYLVILGVELCKPRGTKPRSPVRLIRPLRVRVRDVEKRKKSETTLPLPHSQHSRNYVEFYDLTKKINHSIQSIENSFVHD